jgi:hypothetical protein
MDFDGKVERDNMKLGYNDARKTFDDAWGSAFTFEKDESFAPLFNALSLNLAKEASLRLRKDPQIPYA